MGCSDPNYPDSDIYKGRPVKLFQERQPEDVESVSVIFTPERSGERRIARSEGGEAEIIVEHFRRHGRRHSDVANQVNVVEIDWKTGPSDKLAFGQGEEIEAFGQPTGWALRRLMMKSKPLD